VIAASIRWLLASLALLVAWPAAADLVTTIERVKPSVVMVGTYNRLGAPQFTLRGTGFAIGDGRTIATNAHVIADLNLAEGASLVVRAATPIDRARPATVLSIDKAHDLALLRIDGGALPPSTRAVAKLPRIVAKPSRPEAPPAPNFVDQPLKMLIILS
jgi:S1-C subfamily serine protease